jgi:hypothetical protein
MTPLLPRLLRGPRRVLTAPRTIATDIHDGNLKPLLGLMWTLVHEFQLQSGDDEPTPGGKTKSDPMVPPPFLPLALQELDTHACVLRRLRL